MALVKLGGLAQDVRGTLNGSVFSRNRGGAYVRTKVSPVQPITDFNTRSREIFGAVAQRWSTFLTDAQRAGWVAFAAVHPFVNVFGDATILNGNAFYMSVNRRLGECGLPYIDVAPSSFDVPAIGEVVVTAEVTAGVLSNFEYTGRALDASERGYVFCTPPLLGARTAQKNDFRLLNSDEFESIAPDTDVKASVLARFVDAAWAVDSRGSVLVAYLNKDTGAISSGVASSFVVVSGA